MRAPGRCSVQFQDPLITCRARLLLSGAACWQGHWRTRIASISLASSCSGIWRDALHTRIVTYPPAGAQGAPCPPRRTVQCSLVSSDPRDIGRAGPTRQPNGITLREAQQVIEGALMWAEANGLLMTVAVVDIGGHPVAMARM